MISIKKTLFFLIIATLFGAVIFYVAVFRKNIVSDIVQPLALSTETKSLDDVSIDESFESDGRSTGEDYAGIDEKLTKQKNVLDNTKFEGNEKEYIYLKLAYYKFFFTNRPGVEFKDDDFREAYNDLFKYNSEIDTYKIQDSLDRFTLKKNIAYVLAFINSKDRNYVILNTNWVNYPETVLYSKKYKNDKRLVVNFLLETVLKKVETQNDSLIVAVRMNTLAKILNQNNVKLDKTDKAYIISEMERLNKIFSKDKETNLSKLDYHRKVDPFYLYTNSLMILSFNSPNISSDQVEKSFDMLYKIIGETTKSKDDIINYVKFKTDMVYAGYIFEKNGNKVDDKVLSLIEDIVAYEKKYSENPTMLSFMQGYVTNIQDNSPIYKISRQNKDLKDFLQRNKAK